MGNYDKNSWKEKIDPNFDKPIKFYLKFLRTIQNLPNDGQISFKDEFKESINKNSHFQSFYKHEFKKEMLGFHKGIGLINEEELRMLKNLLFSINKYNNILKKLQTTTFQFFRRARGSRARGSGLHNSLVILSWSVFYLSPIFAYYAMHERTEPCSR